MNYNEMSSATDGKPLLAENNYSKICYDLCKAEYPELIRMAKLLLSRAQNDYDNQVGVEGQTGSGKSMFTLCLNLIMHHLLKMKYDISKQTLFIPNDDEMRTAIRDLKPLAVYWIDEAIRALDKKRWYSQDQIELNHIIKTERWKRNTLIYCMPEFSEFSNSFRTGNIYFRIYIIPRFAAVLYVKDIDKDVEDPWHTRVNRNMKFSNKHGRVKYTSIMTPYQRLAKEKKLPNYFSDTAWPDLSTHPILKKIWGQYLYLKEESREVMKKKEEEAAALKLKGRHDFKFKQTAKAACLELKRVLNLNGRKLYQHLKLEPILSERAFTELCRLEENLEAKRSNIIINHKEREKAAPVPNGAVH